MQHLVPEYQNKPQQAVAHLAKLRRKEATQHARRISRDRFFERLRCTRERYCYRHRKFAVDRTTFDDFRNLVDDPGCATDGMAYLAASALFYENNRIVRLVCPVRWGVRAPTILDTDDDACERVFRRFEAALEVGELLIGFDSFDWRKL